MSLFWIPSAKAQTILPQAGKLAKKLQEGTVTLSDLPLFVAEFVKTLILVAGIAAFVMLILGGYYYIVGGVYTEMKEKGKSTITNALLGFILALAAYAIVNIIQLAVTS